MVGDLFSDEEQCKETMIETVIVIGETQYIMNLDTHQIKLKPLFQYELCLKRKQVDKKKDARRG